MPVAAVRRLWLIVLVLGSITPGLGASETDSRRQQIAAVVEAQMQRYQVPGVSVALIDNFQVAWTAGFGQRREGENSPVEAKTLFQAASISKPITAMAALVLVERGQLELDAPVNEQLKSWQIPASELTRDQPIKLRQLLSHHSGLSVHGFRGYAPGAERPTLIEVLEGKPPANSSAVRPFIRPGDKFQYSGGGYCVIQQLLCDATGEAFPKLMREIVLAPEEMTDSTFEQPLPESLAARAASGHRKNRSPVTGNWHVHPEMAAAGLWTTPHDLAIAAVDVAKCYQGSGGKLLSRDMARAMLTRQNKTFGLGFVVVGDGQRLAFQHSGGNEGFRCQLLCYPATGQGLVIMTNSDTGGALIPAVIEAARLAYAWPAKQASSE